jgi:hypothetical protein
MRKKRRQRKIGKMRERGKKTSGCNVEIRGNDNKNP